MKMFHNLNITLLNSKPPVEPRGTTGGSTSLNYFLFATMFYVLEFNFLNNFILPRYMVKSTVD
jgi:hypothetical protein